MKGIFTFIFLLVLSSPLLAFEAVINFTTNPTSADIFINGQMSGKGKAMIVLERADVVEVKVVNAGYKTYFKAFKYDRGKEGYDRGTNNFPITLEKDESFVPATYTPMSEDELKELSVGFDSANIFLNFVVDKKYTQREAWKMVKKIVADYFDDLESMKDDTAYIKTSWSVKAMGTKKIRTRIIIRTDSENPLTYKVKLQSEFTSDLNATLKENEKFKEWGRLLKKYKFMLSDFNKALTTHK